MAWLRHRHRVKKSSRPIIHAKERPNRVSKRESNLTLFSHSLLRETKRTAISMEPPIPAGFAPSRLTLAVPTATRVLEQHFVCIVLNLEVCSSRQSTFGRGSSGVDMELQKSSTHGYTICAADHPKRRSWCWLAATYIRTKFVAHCTLML